MPEPGLVVRQLTAAGRGAVAVLALEGPGAAEALASLTGGALPAGDRPRLVRLALAGGLVEQALAVAFEAEGGERRLELHLHGSPPVVAAAASALRALGQVTVGPSEAVGLAARARKRLAAAPCEVGARILLDQAEGALERELARLARAARRDPSPERLRAVRAELAALARLGRSLAPFLRAPHLVLSGPVNAGKSTLFNLLVGARRAVTSDEPGTTRDAVRARARLGELAVELVDTAGLRAVGADAAGRVEGAGQLAGRALARAADLVLWLSPPGAPAPPEPGPEDPPRVEFVSRAAQLSPGERGPHHLAALEEPEATARAVARAVALALRIPREPWVPGRAAPFEPELAEALDRLARSSGEGAQLAQALEVLAAGDPPPPGLDR